jgi:hypothetical protein
MLEYIFNSTQISINIYEELIELTGQSEIQHVLKEGHGSMIGGHQGIAGTMDRIQGNYFWPNMTKDIKEYVENCDICHRSKHSKIKRVPMKITSTAKSTFSRIVIDLVGPFKETSTGSKYVLSMMCDLSRYVILVAIPDATAESVAKGLSEKLFCVFSAPDEILSDKAANFTGKVIQSLCRLFKIKKLNSTSFRPQSQGFLERFHLQMASYLRCFLQNSKEEWDTLLPYAAFSHNTKKHPSTGYSPFRIVFGKEAKWPLALHRKPEPTYNYRDIVEEIKRKNQLTWSMVRENIERSKQKTKKNYDKNTADRVFKIGDSVYLKKEARSSKLDDLWSGPYKVLEINTPQNITILVKNKPMRVHVNRVKQLKRISNVARKRCFDYNT